MKNSPLTEEEWELFFIFMDKLNKATDKGKIDYSWIEDEALTMGHQKTLDEFTQNIVMLHHYIERA